MSKRKSQKDTKRCLYCDRIIDRKDVVCEFDVINYIKKQGYKVIDPITKQEK